MTTFRTIKGWPIKSGICFHYLELKIGKTLYESIDDFFDFNALSPLNRGHIKNFNAERKNIKMVKECNVPKNVYEINMKCSVVECSLSPSLIALAFVRFYLPNGCASISKLFQHCWLFILFINMHKLSMAFCNKLYSSFY